MIRLFLWAAFVVLAATYVPFAASLLGYDLAGRIWSTLHLTAPFLSQAGVVLTGFFAGLVVSVGERGILRKTPLLPPIAAGVAVGLAHAIFPPLTVIALPLAAGVAAFVQNRNARFVRAQAIAAGWIAIAWMLPFPRWAVLAFLLGAAVISAWGVRST